ncbi:MAG: SusC/RagA family TonB-linked outer membrane protein [Gemmatimonadetes bacterium]|nr:MAG: SusC/RagA family TonB-linked outer membrane protein [Gemmatimonadota bacterium]
MHRFNNLMCALLTGAIAWTAPLTAQQSTGTIRGRIIDNSTQQPIAGVLVTVGARNARTEADGRYTLTEVPAGSDLVHARLIGYAAASQPVMVAGGETVVLDLTMNQQAVGLSAVVVTGYGAQRAGDITGAVSQVSDSQFNPGRVISPAMLIQNKVPGVQVVDNNEPGGGLAIRIRGATSVTADNEPLYVVDGLPVGTGAGGGLSVSGRDPLNTINPSEIESITILRDASSAAIYGANAANGVVLIETKRGHRGSPQFEYTGSISGSVIDRVPDMLNAQQFRNAVQTYAPVNVPQLGNANTNWFDQVSQTGMGADHNLVVSGAGDAMNWRMSLGYTKQEGVIIGTTTQRTTLGLNYGQRLFNDRFDLSANIKFARANYKFTPGAVVGNAAQMGPTQPIMDTASTTGFYEWSGGIQSPDNPVAILALGTDEGTNVRSIGNVHGQYSVPFLEGLKINLNLGYDGSRADRESFSPSVMHSEQKSGYNGEFSRNNDQQTNQTLETYLNYTPTIGAIPGAFDLTGGYSYQKEHGEYPAIYERNLSTDLLGVNGIPSAGTVQNRLFIEDYKLISFFGRLNYNYQDRYLASVSLRRDGSSRFGPDNAWGNFPAFSVAWRISQESFLRNVGWLSELKLRAARATTGNQAFGNYLWAATYTLGDAQTQAQFGNEFVSTLRPTGVDPNIRWEETRTTNGGFDFGLFGQRFTGSVDWYSKNTDRLIFRIPAPAGSLSSAITTNIGSMSNTGFELSLNSRILEGSGSHLKWSVSFNASHNTNQLTTINPYQGNAQAQQILTGGIAGGVGSTIQVLIPGEPVNSFFVYQQKYDASGKPIYDTDPLKMYVDRNGDGIINVDDRRPFHDPAPKWIFGMSNYLTAGHFDLSFVLRAYTGNYVYNNVASSQGAYSEVTRGSPYNLHASVLKTGFQTQQLLSDYYVEDASFLRMDNIAVGYAFNYQRQPLRVFGAVQNAFTLTGYSGVDPTSGLNGIDNNRYPRARTFSAGLAIQF